MKFNVSNAFPQLRRELDMLQRQHRAAAALALTRTAQDVSAELQAEMARVFNRPTPWTLNSIRVLSASREGLEAVVMIKDEASNNGIPAATYLLPQIEGGQRHLKRFERALEISGNMPVGWHAVPGRFARLDGYGNVSKGQIIQILSQLRVTQTAGYTRNISTDLKKKQRAYKRAGGQYFALPLGRGRLLPGIYQARDTAWGRAAPRPVFIFVRTATYRKLFEFSDVAERTALAKFPANYDAALAMALRTAR